MIQLTNETRVVDKDNKVNKKGDVVDNSLYLVKVDNNNLALKRGDVTVNYFGDVRVALKRSINYAIKGSSEALTLEMIAKKITSIHKAIDALDVGEL